MPSGRAPKHPFCINAFLARFDQNEDLFAMQLAEVFDFLAAGAKVLLACKHGTHRTACETNSRKCRSPFDVTIDCPRCWQSWGVASATNVFRAPGRPKFGGPGLAEDKL